MSKFYMSKKRKEEYFNNQPKILKYFTKNDYYIYIKLNTKDNTLSLVESGNVDIIKRDTSENRQAFIEIYKFKVKSFLEHNKICLRNYIDKSLVCYGGKL